MLYYKEPSEQVGVSYHPATSLVCLFRLRLTSSLIYFFLGKNCCRPPSHTTTINVENEWRMILKIIGNTSHYVLPSTFWEVLLNTICFKQQNYLFWGNRSQCFPKINNCKCILAITATPWAQLLQILGKIAIFKVKKLNKCMW